MKKYFLRVTLGLMGLMGILVMGVVNAQEISKDIIIEATATESGQTLKINKYFANAYTVDRGDGSPVETVSTDRIHIYSVASGYTITLSTTANRWTFQKSNKPLVPKDGTTVTGVKITYMPSLADGFGTNATNPGNNFFYRFNENGVLISLPDGSFDTSNITIVGDNFFYAFNYYGTLISLPDGSFDISNITSVGDDFFYYFNSNGALTSLPDGSFNISNITSVGDDFFFSFSREGLLTSLPEGSFDTSNIITVGDNFFLGFNYRGALTSLPEGSFDTSNITTVGNSFFRNFNNQGQIINMPKGSFDISNITIVEDAFFSNYNYKGALTSLPDGSFDISKITSVGDDFFRAFNNQGQIVKLPDGSFDTSNIMTVENNFFYGFNHNGHLISLPKSFKLNSVAYNKTDAYANTFNSPNYILNIKVSDLVSGVTVPNSDRNTFSDNQPGRCGVDANWLVTPATACKTVIFETNSGTLVDSQVVDIDVNEKVVKPADPTKIGYAFSGWYSDENLTEMFDFFTVVTGDTTLYAKWTPKKYIITLDVDGTLTVITGEYGSLIERPSDPEKNGYRFIGWEPEIPNTMSSENMTVKAKWEKLGSSGGGGGSNQISSDSENKNDIGEKIFPVSSLTEWGPEQLEGQNDASLINRGADPEVTNGEAEEFTPEFQEAYEFAKENGITTMPTIQKADMEGKLTRIAMAKMLSQYAVNVLGQKPANIVVPKFNDVTNKQNSDYDNGVILAYQLGIMGQNMPNNKFRPNDEVTRAEFATALSRMLYGISDGQYESTSEYYTNHMNKLNEKGIITKVDPKMKELRGYVMIMLMRSIK